MRYFTYTLVILTKYLTLTVKGILIFSWQRVANTSGQLWEKVCVNVSQRYFLLYNKDTKEQETLQSAIHVQGHPWNFKSWKDFSFFPFLKSHKSTSCQCSELASLMFILSLKRVMLILHYISEWFIYMSLSFFLLFCQVSQYDTTHWSCCNLLILLFLPEKETLQDFSHPFPGNPSRYDPFTPAFISSHGSILGLYHFDRG